MPFVTLLSPSLPQQLNAHFLVTNNTLSAAPLYFIFIGLPLLCKGTADAFTESKADPRRICLMSTCLYLASHVTDSGRLHCGWSGRGRQISPRLLSAM